MAYYDSKGNKIGRNSPCPCGSGKKFKRCHGVLQNKQADMPSFRPVPDEIMQKVKQQEANRVAFQNAHGKGREIITAEFKDYRFVAVGNEVHFSPKDKTKCFPDFLGNYLRGLLGQEWGKAELAKPLSERHQIMKWYDSMCRYQQKQTPDSDGIYRCEASGALLSWYRLAYDLYLIKHNAALQKRILDRLRHKDQFQGARFELCVTASMISAGFNIEYEREDDRTRKHAEFIATHASGLEVSVEAKSRHRDGILDFRSPTVQQNSDEPAKVAVEGIIRKALSKEPGKPYFIFVEVNLPPWEEQRQGIPWFKEMSDTVTKIKSDWQPGSFPANAIFFCNDPTHQALEGIITSDSFWCYEVPIEDPQYALTNKNLSIQVAKAVIQHTSIPNEFPKE